MKKELLVFTHTKRRCEQMREYFEGPRGEFLKLEATARPGTGFGGGSKPEAAAPPESSFGGGDGSRSGDEEEGGDAVAGGGWFLRWEMGNPRPSRKQVAPAIASFYESISDN